mmetsp:Transcript_5695/g.14568  ORF Transcript_5695/g.14568 Transcript_5695/m.14568 type:complete len:115 (+) Transcript_5695:102-446(+)
MARRLLNNVVSGSSEEEIYEPPLSEPPLTAADSGELTPHGRTVLVTVTVGSIIIVGLAAWALAIVWKLTSPRRRPVHGRKLDAMATAVLHPMASSDSMTSSVPELESTSGSMGA